jgi:hypothetical protein
MNGAQANESPLFRGLIAGYPGAGKTGALAALVNAGFKLRIIDFDGNPESVIQYTKPELRANIDYISFEDKLSLQGAVIAPVGMPTAFPNAWRALDDWKYPDPNGEVVDKAGGRWTSLGASKDWGSDTIVVLDGITGISSASMAYARAAMNKTVMNTTRAVWGVAANNVEQFLSRCTSMYNKHHFIAIAHLKPIGPEGEQDGDSDFTKQLKEEKAALIPTKLFPTAVGRQLPQHIAGHFPIVIAAEVKSIGNGKVKRTLSALAREDQTTKLPVADLAGLGEQPIDTGLLAIFDALGVKRP